MLRNFKNGIVEEVNLVTLDKKWRGKLAVIYDESVYNLTLKFEIDVG